MNLLIKNANVQNNGIQNIFIEDDVISAIGLDEVFDFVDESTQIIDVQGNLVIPGINDSHMHLLNVGNFLTSVNCYSATSIEDVVNFGIAFIENKDLGENELILGMGWNNDYFTDENRLINRFDLDRVSTTNPVIFRRACGHVVSCNTKALELLGIDQNTLQVDGGVFEVDENNFPTGVFNENAIFLIRDLMPSNDVEGIKELLKVGINHALASGITSVGTNDYNDGENDTEFLIQAITELEAEGNLNVRVNLQCCFDNPLRFKSFIDRGYYTGYGSDYFKIGPLKMFVDGSLGARTALMRDVYNDDSSTNGVRAMSQDLLDEMVSVANENQFQVMVHAIGDAAIESVLESYEKVIDGENTLRHGVNHCQITDVGIINRFSKNNILAYVQPIFLHYDLHIVESRVGKELASTSYAFNTMLDKNIHTIYGTDAPIEDLNPFECIHCAVNRTDLKNYPQNGFYPSEKVSVSDAINCYTIEGAYSTFEENVKGRIENGMLADLVVVDRNLYTVEPLDIKNTVVKYTIVGGKIVYSI